MNHENEIKQLYINNAIRLIAEGGFPKATTKALTFVGGDLPDMKMNEVYLYRLFGSKEDLYAQTFHYLDRELIGVLHSGAGSDGGFEENTREKLYGIFSVTWQFAMENEEHCRCYLRYYYSPYFSGKSQRLHRELFAGMVERLVPVFNADADVISILHSVFTAMFDFAVRVYNGELENNGENRAHIFNLLYHMMAIYMKRSNEGGYDLDG